MPNQNGKTTGQSRRQMLTTLGAGAVAAALAPTILRAEGKAVTVGKDSHTYEWINFCQLPETHKFGNTHGVQVDSQNRVFVHSQGASPDSVLIFDDKGKFIKSWGKEYTGGAHGLQLVKEDGKEFLILAATGQHIVVKTTLDGDVVWKIDFPKECEAYQGKNGGFVPTNVAVAKSGDIYVSDGYGKHFVHQYDKTTKYIRSWGGQGNTNEKLSCPHGIWIDTRSGKEEIVVADRSNVRLQYFDLDGKYVRTVSKEGDRLRHPCHFDEYKGELLIPDLNGRVTLLDKENNLICHLGDNQDPKKRAGNGVSKEQWVDGQFIAPHGACYDKDGNIFVAEWVRPGRVTKLKRVGA